MLPLSVFLAVGFLVPPRPADGLVSPPRPAESSPTVSSRTAGVRPTRTPSLRHLELLQVEVALAGLLRTPLDAAARTDLLARSGIFGSEDLRRAARDTREAALLLPLFL